MKRCNHINVEPWTLNNLPILKQSIGITDAKIWCNDCKQWIMAGVLIQPIINTHKESQINKEG